MGGWWWAREGGRDRRGRLTWGAATRVLGAGDRLGYNCNCIPTWAGPGAYILVFSREESLRLVPYTILNTDCGCAYAWVRPAAAATRPTSQTHKKPPSFFWSGYSYMHLHALLAHLPITPYAQTQCPGVSGCPRARMRMRNRVAGEGSHAPCMCGSSHAPCMCGS